MARWRSIAIVLLTIPSVAAPLRLQPPSHAADQPPLSAAQIALFESDHLRAIKSPATLDYKFQHTGSEPYEDSVALEVREVHDDGSKDVLVEFLTGEHQMAFSPVTRFHGNPLIMYFLEWDVRRMHETTGGSNLYFRDRIREAFADQAEIDHTSITLDSGAERATAITLRPYRDDPGIERYAAFRDKTYRFVLSDAVPGTVYEIEASVPGGAEGPSPIVDRVTYREIRE
jgi:hypothetical protein